MALFFAKDSDRLSLCSFNLDTSNLWYSWASADFCTRQSTHVVLKVAHMLLKGQNQSYCMHQRLQTTIDAGALSIPNMPFLCRLWLP